MDFNSLKMFHEKNIKNKKFNTILVGDNKKINFKDLRNYGKVIELSLEDLFGY